MCNPVETNPYASSDVAEAAARPLSNENYGGIRRLPFFCFTFVVGIVHNIVFVLAIRAARMTPAANGLAGVLLIVAAVGVVGLFVGILYATSRRLVNLGSNPWWCLGILVPFLNLYVGFRCLVCPEGYDDHKTLDSIGRGMIGCFIGMFAMLAIAVVFLLFAA